MTPQELQLNAGVHTHATSLLFFLHLSHTSCIDPEREQVCFSRLSHWALGDTGVFLFPICTYEILSLQKDFFSESSTILIPEIFILYIVYLGIHKTLQDSLLKQHYLLSLFAFSVFFNSNSQDLDHNTEAVLGTQRRQCWNQMFMESLEVLISQALEPKTPAEVTTRL